MVEGVWSSCNGGRKLDSLVEQEWVSSEGFGAAKADYWEGLGKTWILRSVPNIFLSFSSLFLSQITSHLKL